MQIWILVLLVGSTFAADCATCAKCKNPYPNLLGLLPCRLTSLLPPSGGEKVVQLLMQQCCNGSTIEELGSNFLNTLQKGADDKTYTTAGGAIGPFTLCLMGKGSSLDKATSALGVGFRTAIGGLYTKGQNLVAKFKGKCVNQTMYNVLAKYTCPLFNATTIQRVIDATKAQMGSSWTCVPSNLSPNVLNLTQYKV